MTDVPFRDRTEAGRQLAELLTAYAHRPDVLVLALPRGGVPVAAEVAKRLEAPLDIFLVRKLGVPGHEELAMGAVASGGVRVLNADVLDRIHISDAAFEVVAERELRELERREREYRGSRPEPDVRDRTVVLVDDGLATGSTMRAAAEALRREGAGRIVVAVPVGPPEICDAFRDEVDEMVCAITPARFFGVGSWYDNFTQTTDEEVRDLLARSRRAGTAESGGLEDVDNRLETHAERADVPAAAEHAGLTRVAGNRTVAAGEQLVRVRTGGVELEGTLVAPPGARGVVLFAHGSGSSRHSSRNRQVARALQNADLATLLIDLLTSEEETVDMRTRHLRFDIPMLAERLVSATEWLAQNHDTAGLPVGLFGASTGGGAALIAAAERPDDIRAVVSRGGRPDLAGEALPRVRAPTLLIVGGEDVPVIGMNRDAMSQMTRASVELEIVPGATHLFEEPGTLEIVARLATDWLLQHLARRPEDRAAG